MTRISSPTTRRWRPSAAQGWTSSQASGAPSDPWRGAFLRDLSVERITPTGLSREEIARADVFLIFIKAKVSDPYALDYELFATHLRIIHGGIDATRHH